MNYRRLGSAGLKVSELSFGAWVSFKTQMGSDTVYDCMVAAYDAGVNFFDNAEAYAGGEAEVLMGEALRRAGWRRASYSVSTKFYWGLNDGPNEKNTLNRKYLMQAIDGSLKRLGMDYVTSSCAIAPTPTRPSRRRCGRCHDLIASGRALFYWGTSEWSAAEIMAAWRIAIATTCTNRRWSSRSTTCCGATASRRSTRVCTTISALASPSGARWRRVC